MKDLKYPIANDENLNIIKAADALKGVAYYCVFCHKEMVLRKSERQLKRTHFAHKALSPNCTPESALHLAFKNTLYDKIQRSLEEDAALILKWQCSYCLDEHQGNLLKKIVRAELEYDAGRCIPDIALFDDDNMVFAAVEIVMTHPPDDQTRKYYNDNNIIVVEFHIKNEDDLDLLTQAVLNPAKVSICLHDKCRKCGKRLSKKYMQIIAARCYNCLEPIKVALLTARDDYLIGGPEKFSVDEWHMAEKYGVKLKFQHSKTLNASYLANTCPSCHKFIGQHYLFTQYFVPAADAEYAIEIIECGYFCHHCHEIQAQGAL
jgi:hypothetical protein